jgi:hypothetical protein
MNEAETRAEHIDPALRAAGWAVLEGNKILREYPITWAASEAMVVSDAVADLGRPEDIGTLFAGFQKYLYQQTAAA